MATEKLTRDPASQTDPPRETLPTIYDRPDEDPEESGTDMERIESALSEWEEAVRWIADGWDCFEEYEHDVSFRQSLQELIDVYTKTNELPAELKERIENVDKKFREATVESALSIQDLDPKYHYFSDGRIELIPLPEYDPKTYWYYYRWQPDCPCSCWRNHDVFSYQKEMYGLDFVNMSKRELLNAARSHRIKWLKRHLELIVKLFEPR